VPNNRIVTRSLLEGRYRLEGALSRGATASTWKAVDTSTGDACVVKELSVGAVVREGSTAHSWDGDFTKVVDLFEREARVLANLDHPGIPRFVDHFRIEADGDVRLFTVQEFVEGETLEALVRGGRHVTEDEARSICRETARILAYLHDRSPPLVHRDVKPSNIILSPDGAVHLVDFGSVRNVRSGDGVDGKTIVGTYGYMPIEQYEARAVPQSDFYALGMTLVFLLSHRDPTEIARTGLTLDFRPLVNVSERFASLIEWMIQPAPDDRPSDATRILGALDANLDNLPALGVPGALAPLPAHSLAPARGPLALAIGVVLLLLSLAGFFLGGFGFTESAGVADAPEARAVTPAGGDVLTLDLDRDFTYVDQGWPMSRAAEQTTLPPLSSREPAGVVLPLEVRQRDNGATWFGSIPLGNTSEPGFAFALHDRGEGWVLYLDANDDRDLTNDGPPLSNEGSGVVLAANATVEARVVREGGEAVSRPYALWIWFDEPPAGGMRGRMYAVHHWAGRITVGDESFEVTAFEKSSHDGLFRDAGVCIDLSRDGSCDEKSELFFDGDVVPIGARILRLRLRYP
jgi:hypothetical protein